MKEELLKKELELLKKELKLLKKELDKILLESFSNGYLYGVKDSIEVEKEDESIYLSRGEDAYGSYNEAEEND